MCLFSYAQAVSEHSDMGREIPRLRSIVSNKSKRIGQLEHMIEETRDKANVDCEKLRLDLEQTRNSHQAKLKEGERLNDLYPTLETLFCTPIICRSY